MSDYLQNPFLKQILKRLDLPLPNPEILIRAEGPTHYNELKDKIATLGTTYEHSDWYRGLSQTLNERTMLEFFPAEMDILLLDATSVQYVDDLEKLYSFTNANIRKIRSNGKILILASSSKEASLEAKVAARALDGFVKSLAKEVGGKGITANLLRLPEAHFLLHGHQAADVVWPLIHFFVSQRSVFITGQILEGQPLTKTTSFADTGILDGKWALVTGAARGIGADTAKALAAEGAKVIVLDVVQATESLQEVANAINGIALPVDITSDEAEKKVQEILKRKNASLDILINNAGIIRDKTIAKMTPDQWRAVLNVNLKSVIRFTNALLQEGIADGASIVGLSSISGIAGNMGQTNYSASKAGMIAYSREIAANYHFRGITSNAIAPGFIETKMTENLPFFVKEGGRRLSALKQGGLPSDIAQAATFFAGPGGKYITGQVLRVCGGSFVGA
jgi:3-oxoacyl-[acyl-carrier protein] reductase